MKRQPYFPKRIAERPGWFATYAAELVLANATLGLPAGDVTATVADARFLQYAAGSWLVATRDFGPAATSALEELYEGPGADPFVLPVFSAPALPVGVAAVGAGALQRIFAFVQVIKTSPNYTEAIGLQLGIVGSEETAENLVPSFTLKVERGDTSEVVRVAFRKYGRPGVAIYSRRNGGAWELLAIDLASPYLDARPLLVATAPETREYRLQYYEAEAPVGDFTAIASVTVAP
ncbi:MAG: hypothetical protein K8R23_09480 [Chthoniobacter sp.]|nr:hypothetical protein [Chthoniobacter sp.]